MNPIFRFVSLVLFVVLLCGCGAPKPTMLALRANDDMKFDKTELVVTEGDTVMLSVVNDGTKAKDVMAHNVVILNQHADVAAFASAAALSLETAYIPPDLAGQIIAHTALAGPGETQTVTFTAPAAGTYDFLCSFPAHFENGMKGKFIVKPKAK